MNPQNPYKMLHMMAYDWNSGTGKAETKALGFTNQSA